MKLRVFFFLVCRTDVGSLFIRRRGFSVGCDVILNRAYTEVPGLDPAKFLCFRGFQRFYTHHAMPSELCHGRCYRRRKSEFIVTLFKHRRGRRRNVTVAEVTLYGRTRFQFCHVLLLVPQNKQSLNRPSWKEATPTSEPRQNLCLGTIGKNNQWTD
jgi:hypothetical protein